VLPQFPFAGVGTHPGGVLPQFPFAGVGTQLAGGVALHPVWAGLERPMPWFWSHS
jgi:hypothetical protein